MPGGIILLDDEQQRELSRSQARRSSQERRPLYLTNDGLRRDPSVPVDTALLRSDLTSLPRTNHHSTEKNEVPPRTDFRSSGEATTLATSSVAFRGPTMDSFMHSTLMTEQRRESYPSYPILRRNLSTDSSTASPSNTHNPGQYAGTSSGLNISVTWNFVGLIIGIILGSFLSETTTSVTTARWVNMPGDLFLRALKCLVVPYVFCSVAVAIGDIVFVGKISIVGLQTAKIYTIFWLSTVTMGICVALSCRPFFSTLAHTNQQVAAKVGFTCADKMLLTQTTNGTLTCSTNATSLATTTTFVVQDLNNVFGKNTKDVVAKLTLSDQIMQTILPIVSSNLVASFANTELLALITFSFLLGSIAGRSYFTKTRRVNYLYLTLLQLRNTFFLLMEWTIWLSPVAVVSIIAGTFASNPKFIGVIGHVYPYLLAALAAGLIQALLIYPLLIFLLTRTNPFSHMKNMVRAYVFAFACASSLATMPVTLSCVKSAKMCSQSLANFVISIGVPASTSGIGFYLPIALVFLAESSGNGSLITPLRIIGIFVLSLLACAGTPPIPAAGLVVISTAYTTIFGEVPTTAFGYVAAMDFFFDRIVTVCNVNDDVMALKIISETTDETVAQDHLGERF